MVSGGFFQPYIPDVVQGRAAVLKKECVQALQLKWFPPSWLCFSHFTRGNLWGLGSLQRLKQEGPVLALFSSHSLCEGFLHVWSSSLCVCKENMEKQRDQDLYWGGSSLDVGRVCQ